MTQKVQPTILLIKNGGVSRTSTVKKCCSSWKILHDLSQEFQIFHKNFKPLSFHPPNLNKETFKTSTSNGKSTGPTPPPMPVGPQELLGGSLHLVSGLLRGLQAIYN